MVGSAREPERRCTHHCTVPITYDKRRPCSTNIRAQHKVNQESKTKGGNKSTVWHPLRGICASAVITRQQCSFRENSSYIQRLLTTDLQLFNASLQDIQGPLI